MLTQGTCGRNRRHIILATLLVSVFLWHGVGWAGGAAPITDAT
jgi:hypothetical protein